MKASPDIRGDPEKLAIERTGLAWQRNLLTNERTFSAWVRTGLAVVSLAWGSPACWTLGNGCGWPVPSAPS
ncbi:MAG: DUF202 domain-containing protein [Anaerolineae bacterium]